MSDEEDTKSGLIELIRLKADRNLINNKIHDLAAQLTILKLKRFHPQVMFNYQGAGVSGIDIQGYFEDSLEVACEVSAHDKYQGNRQTNINEDLNRLENCQAKYKYLSVVYEGVERSLKNSQSVRTKHPSVQIIRVL